MALIDKPGFYTSKAGKCEVVAVQDGFAFGFILGGENVKYVRVWNCSDGSQAYVDGLCDHEITGVWTDKPKPIEAYAVIVDCYKKPLFMSAEDLLWWKRDKSEAFIKNHCRIVSLIEADNKPARWPKLVAAEAARRMAREDRG